MQTVGDAGQEGLGGAVIVFFHGSTIRQTPSESYTPGESHEIA